MYDNYWFIMYILFFIKSTHDKWTIRSLFKDVDIRIKIFTCGLIFKLKVIFFLKKLHNLCFFKVTKWLFLLFMKSIWDLKKKKKAIRLLFKDVDKWIMKIVDMLLFIIAKKHDDLFSMWFFDIYKYVISVMILFLIWRANLRRIDTIL